MTSAIASLCDKAIHVGADLKRVAGRATARGCGDDGRSLIPTPRDGVQPHDGSAMDTETVGLTLACRRAAMVGKAAAWMLQALDATRGA